MDMGEAIGPLHYGRSESRRGKQTILHASDIAKVPLLSDLRHVCWDLRRHLQIDYIPLLMESFKLNDT